MERSAQVVINFEVKPNFPDIRKKRISESIRVTSSQALSDHTTRYHLSNGWFIDHETVQDCTEYGEPYEVFIPGAGLNDTALCVNFARTLNGALNQIRQRQTPKNLTLF